jgi:5-methylcytosine-specific restriction endonuclease McrA
MLRYHNIRHRQTKSCGCIKHNSRNINTDKTLSAKKYVFYYYKHNAARRKIPFELTFDSVCSFLEKECFWCGIKNYSLSKKGKYSKYLHNGIDRIDSSKGYALDNCVSCCTFCNVAKADRTIDNFKENVYRLYNNLFKNGEKT